MFELYTRRPVAVLMTTAAVALFGALSYRQLRVELMPDLAYPTLTVRTDRLGAAPEEIETELTRPIEVRVGTVEGLVGMTSQSLAGRSEVTLEFDWGADMDRASARVRERLARLDLPDAAERPLLLRHDPSLVPVMSLAISGPGSMAALRWYAEEHLGPELSKVPGVAAVQVLGGVEPEVQVRLDVARLARRGLGVSEVAARLQAANVNLAGGMLTDGEAQYLVRTLAEIRDVAALRQVVVDDAGEALVRLSDVAEVVVLPKEQRSLVRVGEALAVRVDVFRQAGANIVQVCDRVRAAVFGSAAQQEFVRRLEAGEITESGEGAAKGRGQRPAGRKKPRASRGEGDGLGARATRAAMERRQMTNFIAHRRPPGSELTVLGDQSRFIRAALAEVRNAALVGGLLAVIILYLFLGAGYPTLVVAVAIPLSVAATFVPLLLFGVSLNIMSLGGLALGIGMLVDNSVVVLESIYRCREAGDPPREAAIRGAREVGTAVVASTLTTVAVFFPLVFVEGVAGQVFGDLAMAVVFSLLASLGVALVVVPTLAARALAASPGPEAPRRWWVAPAAVSRWRGSRPKGALATLGWAVLGPVAVVQVVLEVLANVVLIALAAIALPAAWAARALAKLSRLMLALPVAMIRGGLTALEGAYATLLRGALAAPLVVVGVLVALGVLAGRLAGDLGRELIPEVRQGVLVAEVRLPVGTALTETAARSAALEAMLRKVAGVERVEVFLGEPEAGEDHGVERGPHTASITLRLAEGVTAPEEERVVEAVRRVVEGVPGAEVAVGRPALFSMRPPIRVVLLGHELERLGRAARAARAVMVEVPGIDDVQSSVRPGYPEIQVRFDRARLAALGLTPRQVAERLQGQVEGVIATELRDGERRTEVRVRADPARLTHRRDLAGAVINPGEEAPIVLESVAELVEAEGPAEIRRVDGQRAAVITARSEGFDLGGSAQRVREALAAVELPPGFEWRFRGQDEEMESSAASLWTALFLAVFLVYVVMASQFESLRAPIVIMGSLPLAGIGVFLILWLLNQTISVLVFVGLITLIGIVVNNAIVLVDAAQRHQSRGHGVTESLVYAGRVRLRPILMTTTTTVLGLLPLALGQGEGAELRVPIALTLIGGLVFSTGLTLVVIPVLYAWIVGASGAREMPG